MANAPVCSKKAMHKGKNTYISWYLEQRAFKVKRLTAVNGVHMPQVI